MKYKLIQITTIIILFFSCGDNKRSSIENQIAGEKYKYWDVLYLIDSTNNQFVPSLNEYYFDKKGVFRIYQNVNGKRVLYDGGDVIVPEVWSYISDTTVMIAEKNYTIEKLTKDTFIYSSLDFRRKRKILVVSRNQSRSTGSK